jgi:hypothetical protein
MAITTGSQALASDVNSAIAAKMSVGDGSTVGSFTGNDTVNRSIPHGLGVTPKMVTFHNNTDVRGHIIQGSAVIEGKDNAAGGGALAVTAMDATNFYVGNAGNYYFSANTSTRTHYWCAIA